MGSRCPHACLCWLPELLLVLSSYVSLSGSFSPFFLLCVFVSTSLFLFFFGTFPRVIYFRSLGTQPRRELALPSSHSKGITRSGARPRSDLCPCCHSTLCLFYFRSHSSLLLSECFPLPSPPSLPSPQFLCPRPAGPFRLDPLEVCEQVSILMSPAVIAYAVEQTGVLTHRAHTPCSTHAYG